MEVVQSEGKEETGSTSGSPLLVGAEHAPRYRATKKKLIRLRRRGEKDKKKRDDVVRRKEKEISAHLFLIPQTSHLPFPVQVFFVALVTRDCR